MKHAFKKTLAMLLVLAMVIGVIPSVFAANVAPFTDVDDSDWFAPFVKYVYEHDPQLMNGTSATTFEPDGTCTRAMAAVVLYRLADPVIPSVKPSTFIDLTEDWYKNGIAWAQQKGIVNGVGDNRFDPDGLVTREQLVTMLWRYAGSPKVEGDFLKDFPDANQVAAYAKDAFNWAISLKIIAGSDGKLLPQDNATRAQFAKIISVFDEATKPCEEHTWDEGKVTKEPTCTEEGEIVYTCERCGETKTETLPATGHNYVNGVCTGCGDKLASEDEIVIYYTNDVHTYIDGALSYDNIADLKAQTKSVAAGVLLLDAGDHVQGTAYGSMDKGKTIIELMAAANYDAATLGNHEFDYGMERTLEITKQAGFPYLSCNFYHEDNGMATGGVLDGFKIFEVGGKKIAVVGITTPESFTKSTPKYFQDENGKYIYGIAGGTDGAALYQSVQAAVDAAKKNGADYVIALGHLGDDPSSKPWTSEEVIANTTGIDAFIDGHSHSTVEMKEVKNKDGKSVVLTQTGSYFNAIGRMSITKDGIKTELISEYTGSDKDVAAIKNDWIAEIDTKLGEVIGHTALTFDNYDKDGNRLVRKQETNTGDFAADALYYLFDNMDLDVDLAIMNGGGVRNKAITGDISYKTCKEIHTFGNVACLITVTGQQILDALEWGARDVGTAECGGFLQVSGVSYEIHSYIPSTVQKDDKGVWTAGPTGEYRVKNVKIGGEPLDLTKTYNMAGYNYTLRDCGDGFAMFKGAVNVLDYVMEDYMVLANYVKSFPTKDGKHEIEAQNSVLGANYAEVTGEGRITVVTEKGDTKDEYVLTNTLKDGDKVIFVNKSASQAMSATAASNGYNRAGVAVTPVDNKITTEDTTIVWTVEMTEGGFFLKNAEGQKLSVGNKADGSTYNSMGFDQEDNPVWKTAAAATEGCIYLQNTTATGSSGDPKSVEWYAQYSNFSMFYVGSADETLFAMQMYALDATTTDPDPDPDPDPKPGNEYVLTGELKDGDKVIFVNKSVSQALSATAASNGYNRAGVAVTP
ncbi:MAG: 5'-nucleotidase C-terminal domain-containing protein, partial [Faecousia sp.]